MQIKILNILCLVDLYEEPFKVYDKTRMTVDEGFLAVQAKMYEMVASRFHPRFGAFPIVMEAETWLLADPSVMEVLGASVIDAPEEIPHPASYIEKLKPGFYKKGRHGKSLFQKVSPKRVYDDNCPHFNLIANWLMNPTNPVDVATQPSSNAEKYLQFEEERTRRQEACLKLEKRFDEGENGTILDEAIRCRGELEAFEKAFWQSNKNASAH